MRIEDWPLFALADASDYRERYGGPGSWFERNEITVDWLRGELRRQRPAASPARSSTTRTSAPARGGAGPT